MSILKTEIGTAIPNFLDSEVGLVTKTAQIPQSMGQADGDRKTVFAGTVFPANTSAATGIVFQDVDVTDGDAIGAVMVAGRVISDRVNAASAAQTALKMRPSAAIPSPTRRTAARVTFPSMRPCTLTARSSSSPRATR